MEKMKCVCVDGERFISEEEMIDNLAEYVDSTSNTDYSVSDEEYTNRSIGDIEDFLRWMDETGELKREFQEKYVKLRFRHWLKD